MPKLTRTSDELHLSLSGAQDFATALAQVKSIPGRRFDGDSKLWKFPAEPHIAERILFTVKPTADAAILQWVRGARAERESELTTKLPPAGDLHIPWSDRLYQFQRDAVAFMAQRTKIIEADDMGLGKSLQALSTVYEYLLRLASEQNGNDTTPQRDCRAEAGLLSGLPGEEQGEDSTQQQAERSRSPRPLEQDDSGREARSVRGLRDSATSASDGLGSRTRTQAVHVRELSDVSLAAGNLAGRGDSLGACEVRSALSELPSVAALAARPKLVICPNSAKGVWAREVRKWLGPSEPLALIDAKTPTKRKQQLEQGIKDGAWVVVNYEMLRTVKHEEPSIVHHRDGSVSERVETTVTLKEPLFETTEWLAVIADEAHRIKNRKASQTQGVWRVSAPIMLALTGTPIQNNPAELWSLLKWLYPEQYGRSTPGHPRTAFWSFHDQYTDSYEGYKNSRVVVGVKNPDALRFELKDRLIRRTKQDELDLPEKTREFIPVTLGEKQRKVYADAETAFWLSIVQAIEEGDETLAKQAKEVIEGKRTVYEISNGASRMVRLRQVCSTPALLGGDDDSAKLDACVEQISDNSHKQHVVFTEYVGTAGILVERLKKVGLEAEAYTGLVTDTRVRAVIEDRFQNGDIDVLVGTIPAMGEGLTLTAADTVHFIERSWTPARNEQAEDRLWRAGQKNAVTVLIYEAEDTVDTQNVKVTNQLKEAIVASVIKRNTVKEIETA